MGREIEMIRHVDPPKILELQTQIIRWLNFNFGLSIMFIFEI